MHRHDHAVPPTFSLPACAGPGGHYPTQMGPWRDRQPLVQWCHGATGQAGRQAAGVRASARLRDTHPARAALPPPFPPPGAVYLFCKAHEAVGGGSGRAYLAAAERAGEAVWEHGLLKKGPGGVGWVGMAGWGRHMAGASRPGLECLS